MLFIKPHVSFPLKFASTFSVMHIIPLKFSDWKIIYFGQKEPIDVQFFKLLSALVKVYPIPQMPFFKPLAPRVYSIFASLFSYMKDNSVFFLVQTWYTLENSPNILCHIQNHKSVSLQTLHHSSMSWGITLLYFLGWNLIWFLQKEPIKVPKLGENFNCSG